jgi:hypothetical protein
LKDKLWDIIMKINLNLKVDFETVL